LQLEWDDVRRDLDRLQHATIKQEGKSWELRTEATGAAAGVFNVPHPAVWTIGCVMRRA
jgi:hypothetical protein